ncbi:cytochrome c biogenesis protein CcdA [Candidatus Gracilibacteria bacterium]|nr:cytochrome c biogenesis protein CcdA [Candidatus Gracilibacteria bacterium]
MCRLVKRFFLVFTFLFFSFLTSFAQSSEEAVLYYGNGCPHCSIVSKYIEENNIKLPITKKEVYQNSENATEFNQVCDSHNIDFYKRGVPFLYAENQCFVGSDQIIGYLEHSASKKEVENSIPNKKEYSARKLTISLLVGAAIVDAINPCAFAVLLILMATILASGERKRALFSGIMFSLSIFISYFLMGLGLYSIVASIEFSIIFTQIIGGVALLFGILNLKDFFWYGKGFLMEVPLSWRPRLKKLIQSITGPFGAFLIGFFVSLFLLPCTSGPYIVIVSMLGQRETYFTAVYLLLLYNLIFVFPMLGITIGTYYGMNVEKAEQKRAKNLRILHLIAGIIMLAMGIILLGGFI